MTCLTGPKTKNQAAGEASSFSISCQIGRRKNRGSNKFWPLLQKYQIQMTELFTGGDMELLSQMIAFNNPIIVFIPLLFSSGLILLITRPAFKGV
jgi:hypothetical protein